MPIIALVFTLIFCACLVILMVYKGNQKPVKDFQKLSSHIGLNLALPKQNHFFEIPQPALVGYHNHRYVQVKADKKDEKWNTATTFVMSCKNDDLTFVIKKKTWLERHFSTYKYKDFQVKNNLFTGDKTFDQYFSIHTSQQTARRLFTRRTRKYLLNNYIWISGDIEVKNFEMIMSNAKLLSFGNLEGTQKREITKQLEFLDGLSTMIEKKIESVSQRPEVKRAKLEEKLNFKWW